MKKYWEYFETHDYSTHPYERQARRNEIKYTKANYLQCLQEGKEEMTSIIHNKDNIKSIYMKGNRGIGKNGIIKVYTMYKETYSEPIDFNSELFKERIASASSCKTFLATLCIFFSNFVWGCNLASLCINCLEPFNIYRIPDH